MTGEPKSDQAEPLTVAELAEVRRLHAEPTLDWMPEDGYPIRGGMSTYGVVDALLANVDAARAVE